MFQLSGANLSMRLPSTKFQVYQQKKMKTPVRNLRVNQCNPYYSEMNLGLHAIIYNTPDGCEYTGQLL